MGELLEPRTLLDGGAGELPFPEFDPLTEQDVFEHSVAEIVLQWPDGSREAVTLAGPTTVQVLAAAAGADQPQTGGTGRPVRGRRAVELYDQFGRPTGILVTTANYIPNPPVEIDQFDYTLGDFTLMMPDGSTETVVVSGPTTVAVWFEGTQEGDAVDNDGDGRDEVRTELLDLNLTGLSPTLGPVHVSLNPNVQSLGEMEETANTTPGVLDLPPFTAAGTADSFFDIFFQIEVAGRTFSTRQPKHLAGRITHKPPAPGDLYGGVEPVELYDRFGRPTGISCWSAVKSSAATCG